MSPVAPEIKKKIKIQNLEKGFKEENLKKIGPVMVIESGYPTSIFRPAGTLGFRRGGRQFSIFLR